MSEAEMAKLSVEELIALILELREQNERLAKENAELKRRLEEKERSSKRQAAPFAKGEKKANPKKPGRTPGKGQFTRRDPPPEEDITHRILVSLQGDRCPYCASSNLGEVRIECAFCTDIAEPPKPKVTAYSIEVRQCLACGRTIRGQHPEVDPSQRGATAHRLGEGVFARAHALHYGFGVPMRKVPAILRELCGVSITQSAIQQDAMRSSQAEVGEEYNQLRAAVKRGKGSEPFKVDHCPECSSAATVSRTSVSPYRPPRQVSSAVRVWKSRPNGRAPARSARGSGCFRA